METKQKISYYYVLDYGTGQCHIFPGPKLESNEEMEQYLEEKRGFKISQINWMVTDTLEININ